MATQANRNEKAGVHDRAKLTRLLTIPSGHEVVGVETVIEDETHVFLASVVIVACGALAPVSERSAVLDLNCKVHDSDNLYIVDGSFLFRALQRILRSPLSATPYESAIICSSG